MDKLDTFLKPIADNVQNLEVNSSCGMHVHVDLEIGYDNPLAKRTIINLTKIIYNNQSVIYRLLPTSRRTNQFCRQLRYEEISDLIRTRTPLKTFSSIYKNEHSKRQLKDKAYTYETSKDRQSNNWRKTYHRYHSINLTPLLDIGTIEFRMFDSTLDIEKIKFYIKLVEGISKYAIRSKKVRLFRGTKITNSYKNNRKRLWEFLRALEMTEYYQYCKKLMDEVR